MAHKRYLNNATNEYLPLALKKLRNIESFNWLSKRYVRGNSQIHVSNIENVKIIELDEKKIDSTPTKKIKILLSYVCPKELKENNIYTKNIQEYKKYFIKLWCQSLNKFIPIKVDEYTWEKIPSVCHPFYLTDPIHQDVTSLDCAPISNYDNWMYRQTAKKYKWYFTFEKLEDVQPTILHNEDKIITSYNVVDSIPNVFFFKVGKRYIKYEAKAINPLYGDNFGYIPDNHTFNTSPYWDYPKEWWYGAHDYIASLPPKYIVKYFSDGDLFNFYGVDYVRFIEKLEYNYIGLDDPYNSFKTEIVNPPESAIYTHFSSYIGCVDNVSNDISSSGIIEKVYPEHTIGLFGDRYNALSNPSWRAFSKNYFIKTKENKTIPYLISEFTGFGYPIELNRLMFPVSLKKDNITFFVLPIFDFKVTSIFFHIFKAKQETNISNVFSYSTINYYKIFRKAKWILGIKKDNNPALIFDLYNIWYCDDSIYACYSVVDEFGNESKYYIFDLEDAIEFTQNTPEYFIDDINDIKEYAHFSTNDSGVIYVDRGEGRRIVYPHIYATPYGIFVIFQVIYFKQLSKEYGDYISYIEGIRILKVNSEGILLDNFIQIDNRVDIFKDIYAKFGVIIE